MTEASAEGSTVSVGAVNAGSGTINVGTAKGNAASAGNQMGAGVYNESTGTINVTTATGSTEGVMNLSSGTVNVGEAQWCTTYRTGILNAGTGTVNAGSASGNPGVNNASTGTVNVRTIIGTTISDKGTVNTGEAKVIPLMLIMVTGASCVLASVTVAASGNTTVGVLPNVYKGTECSAVWYSDNVKSSPFNGTIVTGATMLYSSFYSPETVLVETINAVSGLTAAVSGSTVTVTGTAAVTSTNDAALTLAVPAGMTVVWKASLSGSGKNSLLKLTGSGTFEVAAGADISAACWAAIHCSSGKGALNVTGGKISATVRGHAIRIESDWLLTMTGGEAAANAADSCAIFSSSSVVITGGTVSAADTGCYWLYMGETSVYRSGVSVSGSIIYRDSGSVFADASIAAGVTQAQSGTSTGLTVTGHNLSAGDSVTAVWAIQNGVSGVKIFYYSAMDATAAAEEWFLAVPGVTVTTVCTVAFNKNGGDTEASPATMTVTSGESLGTLPAAPTRSGHTFTGWNMAADGNGAAFTASVTVKSDITLYAQWSKNGGTGGGGGVSGGSSTTNPETTVSGSTATTTATAKTGTDGKAAASVTQSQVSDALDKAKAAAGTNGKPDVKIQIDGASGASSVGTTIPQASVQALVSGNAGALTISGPTGAVTFDAAALKTISGAAGGNVTVTASKVDTSTLPDTAKQAVGSHPVYEFSVTSGGKTISRFDGSVTVSVPYTPAAGEDANAIVIYYIAADGKLTMVPDARYDAATGTVTFTTNHFSTYTVGYNMVSFTDVSDTAWYSKAVTFCAARGITTGTTAATFSPDAPLTRGQFITMLLRAYGITADASPEDNFADAGNTYYTGYLSAAKSLGIITGVSDNKCEPDRAVTRQEMFTMLYRLLKALDALPAAASGRTLADFADAGSIADYAKDAMSSLVSSGVITGSGSLLNPVSPCSRAQMAQVLYTILNQ